MIARFRPAHEELAAEEILVVEFRHRALRFFHGVHLHEGETLRALIVFVSHNLGILHLAYAIEEFEEIALRGFEGQVADVESRRCDFN